MTWDSLWLDVHLATSDPERISAEDGFGCVRNGALAVQDGRIAWVGAMEDLPAPAHTLARELRHGQGLWMTPGLVDAHTHVVFGGDRSAEFSLRLHGVSYEEIARQGGGILSTVRATREATQEELLHKAIPRVREMIASGTTAIEIKSGYGLRTEDELKQLRVARDLARQLPVHVHTTFLGAHALPEEYAGRADDYIRHLSEEMLPRLMEENLVDSLDVFCENIAFSIDQAERLFRKAGELNLPVRIHADQLSASGGGLLAARYGALSADHLEYVNEEAVSYMAQAGTVAMLLPGAFYFIRETRVPPVALFRQYGVSMGLATDCNPGTSPVLSLPGVMNMACTLFRMTPEETFRAVTTVGARALGAEQELGMLRPGYQADMALWDMAGPHELSYWIGGRKPRGVIFGGRVVVEPQSGMVSAFS
ncbi:imidazolonepropionase [Acetobacter sp.]|uniref:imidazolonepropionase n=1 Tax=Acetobacter sp. TaxID=440 RepID=UPI0025C48C67|nr:imidazolonepropionase [Acetobacter sp.]MCH4089787.1 imidazolonepropionase [Acetobacter sp.]MCI1298483.1 imidazolonepropionase [Acetobacter sp.]